MALRRRGTNAGYLTKQTGTKEHKGQEHHKRPKHCGLHTDSGQNNDGLTQNNYISNTKHIKEETTTHIIPSQTKCILGPLMKEKLINTGNRFNSLM